MAPGGSYFNLNGLEIAAIITAALGGIAGLGAFIKSLVDSRNATKKADLDNLRDAIQIQHNADLCVIEALRGQVDWQSGQVLGIQTENNNLHVADNALRVEMETMRMEMATLRRENHALRVKVEEQARQITELQNENAILREKNIQLERLTVDLGTKLDEYRSGRKKQTGGLAAPAV